MSEDRHFYDDMIDEFAKKDRRIELHTFQIGKILKVTASPTIDNSYFKCIL